MPFYAHTKNRPDGTPFPKSEWEPLFSEDCRALQSEPCQYCEALAPDHGHLNKVAYLAGKFAAKMFPSGSHDNQTAQQWGYVAGLWHDLGKFSLEFQSYLEKASDIHCDEIQEKIDHTSAGAKLTASKHLLGHCIATAIAGHHAGLLDARREPGASLTKRLSKETYPTDSAPSQITSFPLPSPPSFINPKSSAFTVSFFQRMLFSCLVDADFLATEAFMNEDQKALRPQCDSDILENALRLLQNKIDSFGKPTSEVNKARATVVNDCLTAANSPAGLFSLTVPTGGGKTLSSLAFALKHAIKHGHKRIIYVIPFTSIIEQNAGVFEELLAELGDNIVLEHHSNLSPEKKQPAHGLRPKTGMHLS